MGRRKELFKIVRTYADEVAPEDGVYVSDPEDVKAAGVKKKKTKKDNKNHVSQQGDEDGEAHEEEEEEEEDNDDKAADGSDKEKEETDGGDAAADEKDTGQEEEEEKPILSLSGGDYTKLELKTLANAAKDCGLYFGFIGDDLVLATTRKKVEALREEHKASLRAARGSKEEAAKEGGEKEKSGQDDDDDDSEEQEEEDEGDGKEEKKEEQEGKEEKGRFFSFTNMDLVASSEEEEEEQEGDSSTTRNNKAQQQWFAMIGDEVEFSLCRNKATKQVRATKIKLLKSKAPVQLGVVDGSIRGNTGFVRPLNPGQGSRGLFSQGQDVVDESFKPGHGGRDGSVRFSVSDIVGGTRLGHGDEVEFVLLIDPRTKEARAKRLRLTQKVGDSREVCR